MAQVWSLARELPYAVDTDLKKKNVAGEEIGTHGTLSNAAWGPSVRGFHVLRHIGRLPGESGHSVPSPQPWGEQWPMHMYCPGRWESWALSPASLGLCPSHSGLLLDPGQNQACVDQDSCLLCSSQVFPGNCSPLFLTCPSLVVASPPSSGPPPPKMPSGSPEGICCVCGSMWVYVCVRLPKINGFKLSD